jgi:hypothetical protein
VTRLAGRREKFSRLSRVFGCALAAVSAGLALSGTAWADSTALTTDANGAPLVSAAQLSPGHVLERCIDITTPTAFTSADLGMFVTADGDLASHLDVTVETGFGGGFADCTGFTGRLVYVGTLAALASGFNAQQPQRVGHFSTTVSTVTLRLRFSVHDDNSAQGLTTTAAFWWLPMTAEPTPAPTQTTVAPAPSAGPTTPPLPSSTPISTPTPAKTPVAATTSARPRPAPPPSSAGPTGVGVRLTTAPRPVHTRPEPETSPLASPVGVPFTGTNGKKHGVSVPPSSGNGGNDDSPTGILNQLATGLTTGVGNVAHTVSTAAAPALRGAAYTSLIILPLVLLFLLIQRVIDRRDPKLALAPSYGDPFLGFADRHRLTDRQGDAP